MIQIRTLYVFATICYETYIYIISKNWKAFICAKMWALRKILHTLHARYILVMTMFTDALYKCVLQCFSFMMLHCWRKYDLSMASTGFGTSSNHSGPSQIFRGLLFLRYLCPPIIRAKLSVLIYTRWSGI